MPIDPGKALAAEPLVDEFSWTQDDVILYHLGLGMRRQQSQQFHTGITGTAHDPNLDHRFFSRLSNHHRDRYSKRKRSARCSR